MRKHRHKYLHLANPGQLRSGDDDDNEDYISKKEKCVTKIGTIPVCISNLSNCENI